MMKFLMRVVLSLFFGFLSLILVPFVGGAPKFVFVWLWPGRVILVIANHILPTSWIYGDPASDNYMPDISAGGFAMLCSLLFWSLIFLVAWEVLRIKVLAKVENS
jgi:hypothetical protein